MSTPSRFFSAARLADGPLYEGPNSEAEWRARQTDGDLWVFAYGSLMWRPGFDFAEAQSALLHGWHRSLCILSVSYRGSVERPGLVLGLDRGGSCRGIAYRIRAQDRPQAVAYLDCRELTTRSYKARFFAVTLADGRSVDVYGYVADRTHPQYGKGLTEADRLALIVQGRGSEGSSADYLRNTVEQLAGLGVRDRGLERLWAQAQERGELDD